MRYKGYIINPYVTPEIENVGYWFAIMSPDHEWVSNTIWFMPGVLFHSIALTEYGAMRQAKRAVRRHRKGKGVRY